MSSSADRLINRINALHKSFQLDEGGKLSKMERDLMLGYLRELYELYAHHGETKVEASPVTVPPAASVPPPAPTPPAPTAPAPPAPEVKPVPKPVEEVVKPISPPPAPPKPSAPAPAPTYTPPSPAPVATHASKEIKALFVEDAGANPFGRQPVTDLTRALTINNRVLFSRDLFGNDNELLNTTLRTLNGSGSETAAQPVLESLARRFDWTEEGKKETAREFIELVRRRYV